MSNFLDPLVRMYQGLVETGTFTTAFTKETVLPMVDPNDIRKFAAAAVMDPARFNRKEIELASQMMGVEAVMRDLSRATGKTLSVSFLSEEEVEVQFRQNPFLAAQVVMRDMSQFVDMDEVKGWNIELGTLRSFWNARRSVWTRRICNNISSRDSAIARLVMLLELSAES